MKKILLLLALCGSAHAEFKTGNELLNQINGNTNDWMNAIGYVTGVADDSRGIFHCIPANVTAGQVLDMTKLHMEKHPSGRHYPASTIIRYVLKEAWPCQKGQSL